MFTDFYVANVYFDIVEYMTDSTVVEVLVH